MYKEKLTKVQSYLQKMSSILLNEVAEPNEDEEIRNKINVINRILCKVSDNLEELSMNYKVI